MKSPTLIVSTIAAIAMGAIGYASAQSNTNPGAGSTDPTAVNPNSASTPAASGATGSMGSSTTTGSTGTTGSMDTTGNTSTDRMNDERLARADRN